MANWEEQRREIECLWNEVQKRWLENVAPAADAREKKLNEAWARLVKSTLETSHAMTSESRCANDEAMRSVMETVAAVKGLRDLGIDLSALDVDLSGILPLDSVIEEWAASHPVTG